MRLPADLQARYEPIAPLGQGGFGAVWRARDRRMGRDVAIKLLAIEGHGAELQARFAREARATAALQHPHVVGVFDFQVEDTATPHIVYEFIPGRDLDAWLASEGPAPPALLATWMAQSASALAAAHATGLVHRDLKPGNFVVRDDSRALVLIDFGIVRSPSGQGWKTATGVLLGTPAFLPPEVWRGGSPDAASDQWAWGATMLAAAGGSAYRGQEIREIVAEAATFRPRGHPDLAGLPAPVQAVLSRALAPDPRRRFPDMAAVEAALATGAAPLPSRDGGPGPTPPPDRTAALGPSGFQPGPHRTALLDASRAPPGSDRTAVLDASGAHPALGETTRMPPPAGPPAAGPSARLVAAASVALVIAGLVVGWWRPGVRRGASATPEASPEVRRRLDAELAALRGAEADLRAAFGRTELAPWSTARLVPGDRADRLPIWNSPAFADAMRRALLGAARVVRTLEEFPASGRRDAAPEFFGDVPAARLLLGLTTSLRRDATPIGLRAAARFGLGAAGAFAGASRVEREISRVALAQAASLADSSRRIPRPARRVWAAVFALLGDKPSLAGVVRALPEGPPPRHPGTYDLALGQVLARLVDRHHHHSRHWDARTAARFVEDHAADFAARLGARPAGPTRDRATRDLARLVATSALDPARWRRLPRDLALLTEVVGLWRGDPAGPPPIEARDKPLLGDLARLAPLDPALARAYAALVVGAPAGSAATPSLRAARATHAAARQALRESLFGVPAFAGPYVYSAGDIAGHVLHRAYTREDFAATLEGYLGANTRGITAIDRRPDRVDLAPAFYAGDLASGLFRLDAALERASSVANLTEIFLKSGTVDTTRSQEFDEYQAAAIRARTILLEAVDQAAASLEAAAPAPSRDLLLQLRMLRLVAPAGGLGRAISAALDALPTLAPTEFDASIHAVLTRWQRGLRPGDPSEIKGADLIALTREDEPDLERWLHPDLPVRHAILPLLRIRTRTWARIEGRGPEGLAERLRDTAARFADDFAGERAPRTFRDDIREFLASIQAGGPGETPGDQAALAEATRRLRGVLGEG